MGSSQLPRSFKHKSAISEILKIGRIQKTKLENEDTNIYLHNAAMLTVDTLRNEGKRQRIPKSKDGGIKYQEFNADYDLQ